MAPGTAPPARPTVDDRSTSLADLSLRELLRRVADRRPIPGGGAVAGVTLALGAALGRMVLAYTIGKPRHAEHAGLHAAADESLAATGEAALRLADDDARAYERLNALLKLAEGDARRIAELPLAVDEAIAAPRTMLELARAASETLAGIAGTTNAQLDSDLVIARSLIDRAGHAAALNVRANLPLLTDRAAAQRADKAVSTELARLAGSTGPSAP